MSLEADSVVEARQIFLEPKLDILVPKVRYFSTTLYLSKLPDTSVELGVKRPACGRMLHLGGHGSEVAVDVVLSGVGVHGGGACALGSTHAVRGQAREVAVDVVLRGCGGYAVMLTPGLVRLRRRVLEMAVAGTVPEGYNM